MADLCQVFYLTMSSDSPDIRQVLFFVGLYFWVILKSNIKSVLTAVAVVGMVATGLGLSAAAILDNGKKEVKSGKVAPTDGWYVVTIPSGNPALETNQVIGSLTTAPPVTDTFGCAQSGNFGDVCMVQLSFEPSATTVPATIAAARLTGSLTTVGIKAESPED